MTDYVLSLKVLQDCLLEIKIWNVTSDETIKKLIGHTGWVMSLLVLQDGSLSSCSDDKQQEFGI